MFDHMVEKAHQQEVFRVRTRRS